MGKIIEQTITRFDGGIISDDRETNLACYQMIKNFDAHSAKTKITPFRDSENGDAASAVNKIQNFCPAEETAGVWKLYGCGVKTGATGTQKIFKIDPAIVGTANWDALTKGESAALAGNFNLFHYYKRKGLLYMTIGNRYVSTCDPLDSASFAENIYDYTKTAAHICQGLTHSKNRIMFFAMDNIVLKNDNDTTFVSCLTIPDNLYITSLSEYGEYLAVFAAPLSGIGNSYCFLWDMNATTYSEIIDWGSGVAQIGEQVEGKLIGISYVANYFENAKIVFRSYAGGLANTFLTLRSETLYGSGYTDLPQAKQKNNNYLYFLMSITLNGTKQEGLWKIGRETPDKPFALTFDRAVNNDTALGAGAILRNFFIYLDYVFISYGTDTAMAMSKTNDQVSYTASSVVETLKIRVSKGKSGKLMCVGVMTDPLPAGGSIVMKYKKDNDTSYTTIFTHTTLNSLYHDAINHEATGVTLPTFKEISLQIISAGKAIPVGWYYAYEEKEDTKYNPK
jgi:hypothetical protein